MMMVETYQTLPHLKYLGKYPSHIVSPTFHNKSTSQHNGSKTPVREQSTSPLPPLEPKSSSAKPSVQPSSLQRNGDVPRRATSTSPGPKGAPTASPETKRGRSME